MGVQPYLLSNSLAGLIAQRLVRTLYPHCKEPHVPDDYERQFLQLESAMTAPFTEPRVVECAFEGYRGR